jgi:arabinogalactan oligomer/maltooligosaccharide transport system substrate-binding protein
MSKKFWSLLSLVLVAAMLLAACATPTQEPAAQPTNPPAANPTTAPAQPTTAPAQPTTAPAQPTTPPAANVKTITVWHQWTGDYLTAIQKVFDAYTAAHPDVKFDLSKPDNVSDALKVAIPAGQGPDIIGWANDQIGVEALAGNIVDLDSLGVDKAFLDANYQPSAVQGVIWQGKIWALPESVEAIALVYNKALMQDKYMPKGGTDFTDLMDKAKAFAADNSGKNLFCNQGIGGNDPYHVAPVYFGFGVPTYVDDTGKAYLNTPEAINAGKWLVSVKPYLPAETSPDICKSMFLEGKAAMWWTGPWSIADIENAKIDYGILAMGKPFVGVKTFMITKNAVDRGNAEVALDFMKFFTNKENEIAMTLANKTIPANAAALADSQVQALSTISGFGESTKVGVPMANTPYANAQWTPVGDATQAIWTGSQTPDAALKAAQDAIDKAIAAMK